MYNSSQMFIEAKKTKEIGCIIGHFFLCYYSLFHAMQSLLFLNVNLDSEKILDLSHNEVKKYFEDFYCKGKDSIMPPSIINLFVILKDYRELYSYTMPFNHPQEVIIEMDTLKYYITLCFQLLSLNSFILSKSQRGILAFDSNLREYFERCCYKKDSTSENLIKDDADMNFWYQFKKYGTDFTPYAIDIEFDMDEYGGYDSHLLEKLGFDKCNNVKLEAFSLVYEIIH